MILPLSKDEVEIYTSSPKDQKPTDHSHNHMGGGLHSWPRILQTADRLDPTNYLLTDGGSPNHSPEARSTATSLTHPR